MYAASSIATSDWWTREFIILDGKIVYRGKGDDQERVNLIDKEEQLDHYPGLKMGDINEPNNNAGNWE